MIFHIEIHAQSLMKLVYGSHLEHEINPSNSTIYKLSNVIYLYNTNGNKTDRFTNLACVHDTCIKTLTVTRDVNRYSRR